MKLDEFIGQKTYLWGTGTEGQEVMKWWKKNLPNQTLHVIENNEIPNDAEIIIKSPGVSIYLPQVIEASKKGVKFTSLLNIFFSNIDYKPITIGITGTKGKSGSVSMLNMILQKLGKKVGLAGNIGLSPLKFLDNKVDYLILELSSFQIKSLEHSLDYVMITNISKAHIDWHQSFENYTNDKLEIINHKKTIKILNAKDKVLNKIKNDNIIYYDDEDFIHVYNDEIFEGKEKLNLPSLQIFGHHNLSNICGILSIIKELKLDYKEALYLLKDFTPLEHRLEKVYEKNNLIFINDSIATVPESVFAGVNSFKEDIALIVGGHNNGVDYNNLNKFINEKENIKIVLCLPDTGRLIESSKAIQINNMREAVKEAIQYFGNNNKTNSVILLSPAAQSFGLYKNYKERGIDFTNLAKELMNETI